MPCHTIVPLYRCTAVPQVITEYANRGFRGLGISRAEGDGSADVGGKPRWEMVGLVPLFDPPRHDTKETIERCHGLGIDVKMITGDQLLIGKETAKQLGMGTNMFTTEALVKAKQASERAGADARAGEGAGAACGWAALRGCPARRCSRAVAAARHPIPPLPPSAPSPQGFGLVEGHASVEDLVEEADGFAEVFPEHKFMIVKILQIFQRMTTYSRYTVAMTFRVCFTFGLITVIYDWYFPTILIVFLAVFNDGAMIALSKDRVEPSPVPNRWNLFSIFTSGMAYGLYLTLSSWVFYFLVTHHNFFEDKVKMYSLDEREDTLSSWCSTNLGSGTFGQAYNPGASICSVPAYSPSGEHIGANINLGISKASVTRVSVSRTSAQGFQRGSLYAGGVPGVGGRMVPGPGMLQRASLVKVH
eukprot:scaffold12.g7955.t1